MTTATVLSGGQTGATEVINGVTYWEWGFTVNVDGQVYVIDVWVGPVTGGDNPDNYQAIADLVQEAIEADDPDAGLDGIAQGDGTDDSLGDSFVVGDDDGAVASNGGDVFGDSA